MPPIEREAYDLKGVALALGVSERTVQQHVWPHVRTFTVGRRRLVSRAALQDWIRRQEANESRNQELERQQLREALGFMAGGDSLPASYARRRKQS